MRSSVLIISVAITGDALYRNVCYYVRKGLSNIYLTALKATLSQGS